MSYDTTVRTIRDRLADLKVGYVTTIHGLTVWRRSERGYQVWGARDLVNIDEAESLLIKAAFS